jgi:hypothetical protein
LKRLIVLGLVGVLVIVMAAPAVLFAQGGGGNKVTICHVPPGNPDNAHTIRVGENAAARHLDRHAGDFEGRCGGNGNGNGNGNGRDDDCDDDDNGITTSSEDGYCEDDNGDDNGNGNNGNGNNGDDDDRNGGRGGDDRR